MDKAIQIILSLQKDLLKLQNSQGKHLTKLSKRLRSLDDSIGDLKNIWIGGWGTPEAKLLIDVPSQKQENKISTTAENQQSKKKVKKQKI